MFNIFLVVSSPSSLSPHLHVYHLLGGVLPFFSFPTLACLTSSWWYPPLLLFPHTYMFNIFLVVSSPSSLSSHLHVYHLLGGVLPFFSFPALTCLTSSWWCPPLLLFPCTYMFNIFLVVSSPSSLSLHLHV